MLTFAHQFIVFAFSIGFLVLLHELGHFFVARLFNVKIDAFSIGFGPSVSLFQSAKKTRFQLGLIPLGGYVRMSDGTQGLPDSEYLFRDRPVWIKVAIYLAGPAVNFLLATFLFTIVLFNGVQDFKPVVSEPAQGSVLYESGIQLRDEVISVNGKKITGWSDMSLRLIDEITDSHNFSLDVRSYSGQVKYIEVEVPVDFLKNTIKPINDLGLNLFIPLKAIIGRVIPDSPGQRAQLKKGDLILEIDETHIQYWDQVVDYVKTKPNEVVELRLDRESDEISQKLTLSSKMLAGNLVGYMGVQAAFQPDVMNAAKVEIKLPLTQSFIKSFDKTWHSSKVTINLVFKLLTGRANLKYLSGPVAMAQGTAASLKKGIPYWLSVLAAISVSLGVLNLLPIPMLDGGNIVICLIEWCLGKPLPPKWIDSVQFVGFVTLMMIMFIALSNDFA